MEITTTGNEKKKKKKCSVRFSTNMVSNLGIIEYNKTNPLSKKILRSPKTENHI